MVSTKPVNENQPKRNLSKPENAKWSEWNHKRQWEIGENNTRGRTPRTNENMNKKARQNARENAWERKWQRERERTLKK